MAEECKAALHEFNPKIQEIGRCYSIIAETWMPLYQVIDKEHDFDQLYVLDDDTLVEYNETEFINKQNIIDFEFHRWKQECFNMHGHY